MKHLFTLFVLAGVLMTSPSPGAPQAKKAKLSPAKISLVHSATAMRASTTNRKKRPAVSVKASPAETSTTKSDKPDENKVTLVRIDKSDHKLEVVAGSRVLKTYRVALGVGGSGPKQFEGDMTTPVGRYHVTTRFRPLYHQFIGVSYPNDADRARYAELKRQGKVPAGSGVGHGIGIHGVGSRKLSGIHKEEDWTHGCIAMDDDEIDEFGSLVPEGTPIDIVD
jgi:murein L,D-transpeptidase YafK